MSWQSQYITVNGIQLHYHRTGGDKPAVVLVHGMTDYSLYWSRVVRALEDTYDLVFYDMRGHGLSETPATGYRPQDYARDLLALIATLRLNRPAVIGHSLGAATTITAASLNSQALRCIVLEDPPWPAQVATPEQYADYAENWKAGISALQQLDHAGRVAHCQAEHPTWHTEDCERRAESDRFVQPQIFSGFVPMMNHDWRAMAARVECPALLVTGNPALGGIVTPAIAKVFTKIIATSRVVNIPGAGHAIHREQFDAFVVAVRAFLAEQL
jgi:pimeloyl-ACP methyl ester carboxylesterase